MSAELTPETITDAQVDDFFSNGGEFKEPQADAGVKPDAEVKPVEKEVAQPEKPKEENKVNYGALHEERMRRKEASERAKRAEERAAELERQLQRFMQPRQEENLDDDPVETLKQRQDRIEKFLAAQANQSIEQSNDAKYWNKVKESELAYKRDVPDFDDAVKFLADSRLDELKDLGWSDAEAQKVLKDEIKWIADKAYADEVNPAERFYNLAKRRGYNSQAKGEPKDISADEKLDNIKRGMETNKQLPPSSKSVRQDLTAEALADMNIDALGNLYGESEFDKAWKKLFG